MVKALENLLLQNQERFWTESWYMHRGLKLYQVCSKDDRRLTFELFTARSSCISIDLYGGEKLKNHFFSMYLKLMAATYNV